MGQACSPHREVVLLLQQQEPAARIRELDCGVEGTLDESVLVPSLARTSDADAYGPIEGRPLYRPLELVEWPLRRRHSNNTRGRSRTL